MATAKADGATVVFIAHRISLVARADKVLFLQNGVAELFGTRDEVLPKLTRPAPVAEAEPTRAAENPTG